MQRTSGRMVRRFCSNTERKVRMTLSRKAKSLPEGFNPITDGVIWKQLLVFFFPILLGTFFQQLYNTADAVIVGQFVGKEALAAVGGATGTILSIIVNLLVGVASGTTVIVAQFYGARNYEGVGRAVHTSVALSLAGGAVLMVIGLLISDWALTAMGTTPDVMDYASTYLRIYFLGTIPSFLYNTGAGILRAVGDTKRPLYYLIAACLLNIVLDLIFVAGLGMEVLGVALATILSQTLSAVLTCISLIRAKGPYRVFVKRIRFYKQELKSVLFVGIPAGLQSNMYAISNLLIQAGVNSFGTDTMAAWTAFGKIDGFFWMISGAFGIAITTFAGQNYGAGRIDRVRRSTWICAGMQSGVAVFMSVFMCSCAPWLIRIFTQDEAVIQIGLVMAWYMMPFYICFVLVEVLSGAIRGCGDALRPMIIVGLGVCLFRVVWMFVALPIRHELDSILVSYPVSWVITSLLFLAYYKWGHWADRAKR